MKGPGIQDYLQKIQEIKLDAQMHGSSSIDVSSKELHALMSPNHATMPTCCQALYKCMLKEDEILKRPKGKTGFGSHLIIRFHVENLEREPFFEAKRRGRPPKSAVEEQLIRYRFRKGGNELPRLVKAWLEERGWETLEHNRFIEAKKEDEKWFIDIYQATRGRKMPLPNKLTEVIKKMEDEKAYYSVALVDSPIYRRQWNEIPDVAKDRLKVSVLLADRTGQILEMK